MSQENNESEQKTTGIAFGKMTDLDLVETMHVMTDKDLESLKALASDLTPIN